MPRRKLRFPSGRMVKLPVADLFSWEEQEPTLGRKTGDQKNNVLASAAAVVLIAFGFSARRDKQYRTQHHHNDEGSGAFLFYSVQF